ATAASMALPPALRMRAPACAASGCTVDTTPLRAITSERVCGSQPSERSPRTALHHLGVGVVVLHIWIGDCALAPVHPSTAPKSAREETIFPRELMLNLLLVLAFVVRAARLARRAYSIG